MFFIWAVESSAVKTFTAFVEAQSSVPRTFAKQLTILILQV